MELKDNTLLSLHNSSDHTQPRPIIANNLFITVTMNRVRRDNNIPYLLE